MGYHTLLVPMWKQFHEVSVLNKKDGNKLRQKNISWYIGMAVTERWEKFFIRWKCYMIIFSVLELVEVSESVKLIQIKPLYLLVTGY